MRSVSYVAIEDTAGATRTGSPIPTTQVTQCTVIASVTGATSPVGTLELQASNDQAPGFPVESFVPTTWVTLATTAVSGNGSYQIAYTNVAYEWLRVVYTRTSGTGGIIKATFEGVGPGATSGMAPGGDLAGTQSTQTVIGINGIPIASGSPANGQVLEYNSGTDQLEWKAGTSVTTANAATVFAGPVSGAAAAPSFRALGYSDLPSSAVGISSIAATSGSVAIDLTAGGVQTQTVSGTTTYSVSNASATLAYSVTVVITASGTQTVNFDASWKWISVKPTQIVTGTVAVLMLLNSGANASDVIASWQVLS